MLVKIRQTDDFRRVSNSQKGRKEAKQNIENGTQPLPIRGEVLSRVRFEYLGSDRKENILRREELWVPEAGNYAN